jgi:hypothetical protein
MSEDKDFARVKLLQEFSKTQSEQRAQKVLDVLLTDLSFDVDGPYESACSAIDKWEVQMDRVISQNLDHQSIDCFTKLVTKYQREIEMSQLVRERHAKSLPAINWVRSEWTSKAEEYRSKKEFGQTYETLVLEEFPHVKKVTWRTITEEWLKGL